MKIAITGASGFVGRRMAAVFAQSGHEVVSIGRTHLIGGVQSITQALDGANAVINLAGAPIIGRWTESYKNELRSSRIGFTKALVEAMDMSKNRPGLLVSTSAVGYYAPGGPHTETEHVHSKGFLGNLAHDWEAAALEAESLGLRVVIFRLGVVVGPGGGAIEKMLPPFKLGMGGTIGDGRQPFPWVHIDDVVRAYARAMEDVSMRGVYNLTAPERINNARLTKALGNALNRPAVLRVPEIVLRFQYGEGASVLTEGQDVIAERLIGEGFRFSHPDIEGALSDVVKNN